MREGWMDVSVVKGGRTSGTSSVEVLSRME